MSYLIKNADLANFDDLSTKTVDILIEEKDIDKCEEILKERGIDYKIDEISENFIINFQTKKQEMDFLQLVQKNQIQLLSFNEIGNKLDDIYKKLIKFGSVDTMERK